MHSSQTLIEDEGNGLPSGGQRGLRLLAFANEALSSFPLPEVGEVIIGRAEDADVQLDLPVISRRHARLRIGSGLLVEDLGSSNGTRVHGRLLRAGEQSSIAVGDTIELGSVTLIVQRAPAVSVSGRPRRLWTHSYFESRLEEECTRAEQSGAKLALLRVRREAGGSDAAVQEVLAAAIGPTDLVAAYAAGEYEILLIGQEPARAEALGRGIAARLEERGMKARVALACYPRDGRGPETLMAKVGEELRGPQAGESGGSPVVVVDPGMQQLHELVRRVAGSPISVILMGETGVGKEVFAEAIHRHSPRAQKPFLRLNCAAFSETLLEGELFGYEKGAFTGAMKAKAGLLESADGGTVLLDEVGEMPLTVQAKLLRVLEQREVLRVGELRPRPIDVRFIAATNRNLEAESARGAFRQDLYFRLNGISLLIPPLRERRSEIEGLARAFVSQACRQAGRRPEPALSPDALRLLQHYAWPGNIRELRNVIERAVLFADRTIGLEHLPVDKMSATLLETAPAAAPALPKPGVRIGVGSPKPTDEMPAMVTDKMPAHSPDSEYEAERRRILDALEKSAGNQTVAAKLLGISRRTLLIRLDTYAIPRPRKSVVPPKE